jgi:hypothetical protein
MPPQEQQAEQVELFGPGGCDKTLPANEVVEEYTFGQFVRLRYEDRDGPRPVTAEMPADSERRLLHMLGAAALEHAVTLPRVLADKPEELPDEDEIERVRVRDVDDLLARRVVKLNGTEVSVELDTDAVRQLLGGERATAVAKNGKQRIAVLLAPDAKGEPVARHPAVREHVVSDLAAFLARPAVAGLGGASFPVELDREAIKDLREDGVVTVGAGADAVTVVLGENGAGHAVSSAFAARAGTPEVTDHRVEEHSRPSSYVDMTIPAMPQSDALFTIGLYLPWTQTWRLKGYSRGSLVHSLTLAPQEETTIELFTWDRRKRSVEQSSTFESDQSIEQTDTTKDVMDVVRELSNSSEFKIEGHAKVNVKYAAVEAEIGTSADYTSKLNATARRSTSHLQESTQKAAARIRVSRQTRISEASETGTEERVTRKVRNANMCRTLTLNYFEVLAHYTVTTAFTQDEAQVCFFVPFPPSLRYKTFSETDLRVHERALRGALLDLELADGFQAARSAYARRWAMQHVCDAPTCHQEHDSTNGSGGEDENEDPSRKAVEDAVKRVIACARLLNNARVRPLVYTCEVDGSPATPAEILDVQRWCWWKLLALDYGTVHDQLQQLAIAGTVASFDAPEGVVPPPPIYVPDISTDEKIEMLTQIIETAPPGTLQMIDPGEPSDTATNHVRNEVFPLLKELGSRGDATFNSLVAGNAFDPDDAGLVAALMNFQAELKSYRAATDASLGASGDMSALRVAQRQAELDADSDLVRSAFPLGESALSAERVDALLTHLNEHKSHYRYALLQGMPIGDQMQELAQVGVPTDLVEPRILGMVTGGVGGIDLLAVPINTALEPAWKKVRNVFIDKNAELVALTATQTTRMPTPGVSMEARLGDCDACEPFIKTSREIELEQRRAQARMQRATAHQAELTADRFEARIKKGNLDDPDPDPASLHVTLDKPSS